MPDFQMFWRKNIMAYFLEKDISKVQFFYNAHNSSFKDIPKLEVMMNFKFYSVIVIPVLI